MAGDAAEAASQADGSVVVTRRGCALLRGIADPHPAMMSAWEELLVGALAAADRCATLERIAPLAWKINPGE